MKSQTHQSPLRPLQCYLVTQNAGIDENDGPLQGSPAKANLWRVRERLSVESMILSVSSAFRVLSGDFTQEGWAGWTPAFSTTSSFPKVICYYISCTVREYDLP